MVYTKKERLKNSSQRKAVMAKLRVGNTAYITSGKFRGVQGTIGNVDMPRGYYYVYADCKRTRKGCVSLRNSGLGMVNMVHKSKLKKVE